MINLTDFELGTIIYRITEKYSMPNRITMVDSDGVTWHRYEPPTSVLFISKLRLVGSVRAVVTGTYDPEDIGYATLYFVDTMDEDNTVITESFTDYYAKDCFLILEDAEKELEQRKIKNGTRN